MKKLLILLTALMISAASFNQAHASLPGIQDTTHKTKSGALDKRYNANKHLKKDGTMDMRFKSSKNAAKKTTKVKKSTKKPAM